MLVPEVNSISAPTCKATTKLSSRPLPIVTILSHVVIPSNGPLLHGWAPLWAQPALPQQEMIICKLEHLGLDVSKGRLEGIQASREGHCEGDGWGVGVVNPKERLQGWC